jgi:hypothetical protein
VDVVAPIAEADADNISIASPLEALSVTDSSSVSPHSLATSVSSADSALSLSTPTGFLRSIFPHVSDATLARSLADANGDMEAAVSALMSGEYIRELAERGLDADEMYGGSPADDDTPWVLVNPRRTAASAGTVPKPKKAKARTFAIADVRQQQNRRGAGAGRPAPDPWIQISSLSARLAELVPAKPAQFFVPFFHSPKYSTPAHAMRGALATAAGSPDGVEEHIPADAGAAHVAALYIMFEILGAGDEYDALDTEQRARVMADAQLALAANGGDPDAALDAVALLRELDADDAAASALGPYHSAVPTPAARARANTGGAAKSPRPAPVSLPASPVMARAAAAAVPNTAPDPALGGWQAVPARRPTYGESPYAAFIPAYQYSGAARRGGTADAPRRVARAEQKAVERARKRVAELQARRSRALREASRQWRKGGAREHAGEVALYFAEQARALQEEARREALTAAREMVHARRTGAARDVDLHGTTASEAVVIVREILRDEPCSPGGCCGHCSGPFTHSHRSRSHHDHNRQGHAFYRRYRRARPRSEKRPLCRRLEPRHWGGLFDGPWKVGQLVLVGVGSVVCHVHVLFLFWFVFVSDDDERTWLCLFCRRGGPG